VGGTRARHSTLGRVEIRASDEGRRSGCGVGAKNGDGDMASGVGWDA
jgi:hypothetical protein